MFKKFAMLLAPFVLASFSPLLVNSPALADTSYWTEPQKCWFNFRDYTWWKARIAVRSSDKAKRVVQVEFGGDHNDEAIYHLEAWDSWIASTGQRRHSPKQHRESYNPSRKYSLTETFTTATWISQKMPRYANLKLYSYEKGICSSDINMDK
ncbi:MAG TPA: hypothetical protein VIQ31_06505 [Phormidium sp.]